MIIRKSRKDIDALREAGRVVALAHQAMRAAADVGVSLRDLDEVARDVLREHGRPRRSSTTTRTSPRPRSPA